MTLTCDAPHETPCWSWSVSQSVSQSGETNSIIARFDFPPEQQEDEYGEEQSECAAHDAGDGTKVLLEVDQYHRVLLGGARGESPKRLASCNKRATRRFRIRLKKKKPSPFSLLTYPAAAEDV